MTRIKICGITNVTDAESALECGADALGFILVPGSPRYITEEVAEEIGRRLPDAVLRVGVYGDFSDAHADLFGAVQYYTGSATDAGTAAHSSGPHPQRIRAYRVRGDETLEEIERTHGEADTLLLDAYHPSRLGGSGETFDWDLAREVKARFGKPIILAGGLTPANVGDAIAAVRPYAVDVSSGVEAEPGKKDPAALRAFARAVERADRDGPSS